ncbi:hypothetical protein [Maioricimonas rarisocia]|uniref:hypothetical protein n=1 Tax=Maioricimonas rarisocia TaxID=2528026 RepID=UPI001E391598|nr:hypothetical protein [Maioricimonas rarisocia]
MSHSTPPRCRRRRPRNADPETENDQEEAAWLWWRTQLSCYCAEYMIPSDLQYHGLLYL